MREPQVAGEFQRAMLSFTATAMPYSTPSDAPTAILRAERLAEDTLAV